MQDLIVEMDKKQETRKQNINFWSVEKLEIGLMMS